MEQTIFVRLPLTVAALEDGAFDHWRVLSETAAAVFKRQGAVPGPVLVETDLRDLLFPNLRWFLATGVRS